MESTRNRWTCVRTPALSPARPETARLAWIFNPEAAKYVGVVSVYADQIFFEWAVRPPKSSKAIQEGLAASLEEAVQTVEAIVLAMEAVA